MGITWGAEIVSSLFKDNLEPIWFITDLANTLQGITIFFTFVWKDKVKQLLLKRLGFKKKDFFSRSSNSRNKSYTSTSSTYNYTSTTTVPLQEKFSSHSCKRLAGELNVSSRV